jgi:hypothetical protein
MEYVAHCLTVERKDMMVSPQQKVIYSIGFDSFCQVYGCKFRQFCLCSEGTEAKSGRKCIQFEMSVML